VTIRTHVNLPSAYFIVIALLAIAVCSILAYTISRITSEPASSEYVASVATAIEPVRIRVAGCFNFHIRLFYLCALVYKPS